MIFASADATGGHRSNRLPLRFKLHSNTAVTRGSLANVPLWIDRSYHAWATAQEVEERVLRALQDKLTRQDFFEEFCREFAREMTRLRMEQRAGLEGRKGEQR